MEQANFFAYDPEDKFDVILDYTYVPDFLLVQAAWWMLVTVTVTMVMMMVVLSEACGHAGAHKRHTINPAL